MSALMINVRYNFYKSAILLEFTILLRICSIRMMVQICQILQIKDSRPFFKRSILTIMFYILENGQFVKKINFKNN